MAVNDRWLTMKNGFGAEFFMTDEVPSQRWLPEEVRRTKHLLVAKRYKPVRTALFIVNPATRHILKPDGKDAVVADVTYDVSITKPDGSSYFNSKDVLGWTGEPPPSHLIQLVQSSATIAFETIDPAGEYTVAIVVHDKIRKTDIALQHTIRLED